MPRNVNPGPGTSKIAFELSIDREGLAWITD